MGVQMNFATDKFSTLPPTTYVLGPDGLVGEEVAHPPPQEAKMLQTTTIPKNCFKRTPCCFDGNLVGSTRRLMPIAVQP